MWSARADWHSPPCPRPSYNFSRLILFSVLLSHKMDPVSWRPWIREYGSRFCLLVCLWWYSSASCIWNLNFPGEDKDCYRGWAPFTASLGKKMLWLGSGFIGGEVKFGAPSPGNEIDIMLSFFFRNLFTCFLLSFRFDSTSLKQERSSGNEEVNWLFPVGWVVQSV